MWLGLLYLPSMHDAEALLCAWHPGRDRPFTVAGPLDAVPEMARMLRAAGAGTTTLMPRCDRCLAALDLPPL